jgi:vitamin B12 transporter
MLCSFTPMKNFSFAQRGIVLACAAACASFSSISLAQSATEPQLKPIVVTATRNETRADELVSELVVIDRAQIEQSSGRTLTEILTRQAGLQFSSNGGLGTASNIYIRGTETRHTILLVDGVRMGSATLGTPVWSNIPIELIERIEVLKGPASALYGSDAVGGVVQIFTRQGKEGLFPTASLTLGSRGYRQLSAGVSGGQGALSYTLGLSSTHDDGFSATNSKVPFGNFNPDDDGYRQTALNGSVRWKLTSDWALDARFLQSNDTNQYDDGPLVDTRARSRTGSTAFGLQGKPTASWTTRLSYATSHDKSKTINSATATNIGNFFNTTQDQITWKNDVATAAGIVTLGFDQLKQNVDSTTNYTVKSRTVNSYFAGLNGSAGAHSWQANLRHDKNSQFGNNSTGFVGYGFAITPQWRVNASHGTTFVAPSFNQLYFPGFGNANLQPEKGRNTDLGIAYSAGGHSVKLVRFDNKIRGFITATTTAANIPRARIDGWTLSYDAKLGPWSWRAGLDDFDPRNEVTGKLLPRRNRTQLNLGADYDAGVWSTGVQLLKAGSRFDNAANTTLIDGYTTLDLHGQYKLAKDWLLQASINNLTNRKYETILGYNQPGRGVLVSLRYAPK